jgi:hypothetical protein
VILDLIANLLAMICSFYCHFSNVTFAAKLKLIVNQMTGSVPAALCALDPVPLIYVDDKVFCSCCAIEIIAPDEVV